jgi:hypothetical protein
MRDQQDPDKNIGLIKSQDLAQLASVSAFIKKLFFAKL